MLEVRGVDVSYGNFAVLHNVSLALETSRIVGLFGHNGAGKSSLLKGIYGLLPVRSGSIVLAGEDVTNSRPFQNATRGMRLVPQERNVFPNLTIEDNLSLGALRLAGDSSAKAACFDEVYEAFPVLGERRNAKAAVLSGGQRQMLAIGIALMTRPKVLLLDEPSAGLAPVIVLRLFEMIRSLCERFEMAVLLVEQNVKEALNIVDSVCVLEEGRVVFIGLATDKDKIVRHLWRLHGAATKLSGDAS
jgi:branched-chain amino acid transport system ATP-binding protein